MKAPLDLAALLLAIENAAGSGAGSVRIYRATGGEELGTVWLEGAKISWAQAREAPTTLVDLVLQHTGWSRPRFQQFCQQARNADQPFMELLVESAALGAFEARVLMRRHIEVALGSLAEAIAPHPPRFSDWAPTPVSSRQTSHSFSSLELLGLAGQTAGAKSPDSLALPEPLLEAMPSFQAAICFLTMATSSLPALPTASVGMEGLTLGGALRLYRIALGLVQPPLAEAQGVHPFAVLARQGAVGWFVAFHPPHLCLFRVTNPGDHGLLLSALRAERADVEVDRTFAGIGPSTAASFSRPIA